MSDDFLRRARLALHDMQGRVEGRKLAMFERTIDYAEALHVERDENEGAMKVWRRRCQNAEAERDDAKAELAALREGRGVKVKPLEWTGPRETDGIHHAYDAECSIGHYIASVTDDGRALAFRVGHGGSMYPDGGAVEDAKAAAQADYERRILSALSPAPVSAGDKPEDHCAKCGAPRSNHPYRHRFVPRALLYTDGE